MRIPPALSIAKIAGVVLVIGWFIGTGVSRFPFTTVSPDSIRFMHFAQINADRAVAEGGTLTTALTATLRSIKGMNTFDLGRGRLLQHTAYGVDAMTRWMLPFATLNLMMMLILAANAGMAARLATCDIPDSAERLGLGLVAWVVLATSALVLSPVMMVTLYGKYIWITFLLAHFLARRNAWKVFWLILATYSDEIGLIAVALVTFFYVGRRVVERSSTEINETRTIVRAIVIASLAALYVILVFFGISAIVFNAGAGAFTSFASRGLQGAVTTGANAWDMIHGVFWRAEVMLLGLSSAVPVVTVLIGLAVFALIALAFAGNVKRILGSVSGGGAKVRAALKAMVLDRTLSWYAYWTILLIVIAWLVLPGMSHDLNQYSYPAAILISLLFVKSLADLLQPRRAAFVLTALALLHLALLPRIADQTSLNVHRTLLPDGTVTVAEILRLNKSVEELRQSGGSALFDSMNNGQEIDFSGTWYYSRVKWFGIATEPHWPVQGTVRVLAWPTVVPVKCVRRDFFYTRAEFVDRPCPRS